MFLKPILFLFLVPPPPSLDIPPNGSPCPNEFFIEIDALSFHWVYNPLQCVLRILLFCSMTRQIYVLKEWLRKGSR